MNNNQKVKDKRIEKLLIEIGEVAGLSLDYSFISDKQEIVGVFYNQPSVKLAIIDEQEFLVPDDGVAFFIMTEEEFKNPDIIKFGMKLKESYENKRDLE